MACNCNYLLFFVWLLIVKTDKHLLPWWVRNYYSLNTIVSCLVNRKIIEFYITKKKGRGTRDQIANIRGIIGKAREFLKNIYFCFIDHIKAFGCVDHNKLWKLLQEMGMPDHLTCLLRNLCAGQEATVRTGRGTTDWFQTGKAVRQDCMLSPCLFNFYAELLLLFSH